MATSITYRCTTDEATADAALAHCLSLDATRASAYEPFHLIRDVEGLFGSTKYVNPRSLDVRKGFEALLAIAEILQSAATAFGVTWVVEGDGISGTIGPDGAIERVAVTLGETKAWLDRHPYVPDTRRPWKAEPKQKLPRPKTRALRERWTPEIARELCRALVAGSAIESGPFGRTSEGRLDARGIDVSLLREARGRGESGAPIVGVDFSFAVPSNGNHFGGVSFAECAFDGIEIYLSGSFHECRFVGAKIDCLFGSYDACDFSMARFRDRMTFEQRTCRNSRFVGAVFKKVCLHGACFVSCAFDDASFESSELGLTRFTGCSFEGAAFFNTFYSDTRFESCSGLDPARMIESCARAVGAPLCSAEDIIVVP